MKVPVIVDDFVSFLKDFVIKESSRCRSEVVYPDEMEARILLSIDNAKEEYLESGYLYNHAYFYPAHFETRKVLGRYGFPTISEVELFLEKHDMTGYAVVRGKDVIAHRWEWKIDNIFKTPDIRR